VFEIKSVSFLMPARIICSVDGIEEDVVADVDMANRKVYVRSSDGRRIEWEQSKAEYFFTKMDGLSPDPEAFAGDPEDVAEVNKKIEELEDKEWQTKSM
jgi:hypothetical protein